jgi:hypothetical protein
MSPELL